MMSLRTIKRSAVAAVVIGALCAPVFAAGAQETVFGSMGVRNTYAAAIKAPAPDPPAPPKKEKPKPKPPKKNKKPDKKADKKPDQPQPPAKK